ncbi:hypothetical protein FOA52_014730 [Chlamydomonas sp. UWO 241]|nr:hypothetical protein FOA52_014730 [Chlamydomonas sp. UWO 241]
MAAAPNAMALIKALREKSGAPISDVKACLEASEWDTDRAYDALRKKGLAAAAKKASRHAKEGLVGVAVSDDAAAGPALAVVEINSETDFVARSDVFRSLVVSVAAAALSLRGTAATTTGSAAAVAAAATGLDEGALLLARVPGGGASVADACAEVAIKVAELGAGIAMHGAGMRPICLSRSQVAPEALDRERAVLTEQAAGSGKPAAVIAKMVEGRLSKFYEDNCLLEQKYLLDDSVKVQGAVDRLGKQLGSLLQVDCFLRVQCGEGLEATAKADFADEVAKMAA